jgi:hypothetical protein
MPHKVAENLLPVGNIPTNERQLRRYERVQRRAAPVESPLKSPLEEQARLARRSRREGRSKDLASALRTRGPFGENNRRFPEFSP